MYESVAINLEFFQWRYSSSFVIFYDLVIFCAGFGFCDVIFIHLIFEFTVCAKSKNEKGPSGTTPKGRPHHLEEKV